MTADDTARLIYLSLLGAVILLWFFAQNRTSLGKVTQQALVWGLIFVGVIAAVGLWGDIRRTVRPAQMVQAGGEMVLPRAPDGHYYLRAQVNGQPVEFVIDTGASQIVLSRQDARRVGIDPAKLAFAGRASTANGMVSTAPVRLDSLRIGPQTDRDVRAVVNDGDLRESLLGMSYLQRFSRVEIRDGKMILSR